MSNLEIILAWTLVIAICETRLCKTEGPGECSNLKLVKIQVFSVFLLISKLCHSHLLLSNYI